MDLTRRKRKRTAVAEIPFWWHSIDLGDGVITPGHKGWVLIQEEFASMGLPALDGKTVLDIGAWDGYFSFEAERRGAKRVVALDHFAWQIASDRLNAYLAACEAEGVPPRPFDELPGIWHDDGCPGRRGFDLAHSILESTVEPLVADFMSMDLAELGVFDVALYFGVLYHMRHPLLALERLRTVTGEVAIIESQVVYHPDTEGAPWCQFFERDELNHDWTNWWCPNMAALTALCRAAGFRTVDVVVGPPPALFEIAREGGPMHYRGVVHARP
jgi:tRNA (mo5U34)-methyltransferase